MEHPRPSSRSTRSPQRVALAAALLLQLFGCAAPSNYGGSQGLRFSGGAGGLINEAINELTTTDPVMTGPPQRGVAPPQAPAAPPRAPLPDAGIGPHNLGVVVNTRDPASVALAAEFQRLHQIPAANLIRVELPTNTDALTEAEFSDARSALDQVAKGSIQALALAWDRPSRVGCLPITSAFAFGYDPALCACTAPRSPYFDSPSRAPFDDHRMRPTMMLAGTPEVARAVVQRGSDSIGTYPNPGRVLVSPSRDQGQPSGPIAWLVGEEDAWAFGLIGLFAADRAANRAGFLPGAMADQRAPGRDPRRWLAAGATGSYTSACVEGRTWPAPRIAMEGYGQGETLIEAYWRSVEAPGPGLFVGDPLARPYVRGR